MTVPFYVSPEQITKDKPIKQDIWLLINSDMGDVIEYVHKKPHCHPKISMRLI